MDYKKLLKLGVKQQASDVHISAGQPPLIRINGELEKMDFSILEKNDVHEIILKILNDRQRELYANNKEIDLAISLEGYGRFRVNCFYQYRGESVAFRIIPNDILSFKALGIPKTFVKIAEYKRGLVLITGPTGSGKSTTLAAIIDYINRNRKEHILTIEDPIEFVHEPINCLINQRELNEHTNSFANALRSALREDPDILLVGEMRDLETIQLALTAAETGHLVFATLHTNSAPKTINRIIDVFPEGHQAQIRTQFSETIQAVIAQRLIKKNDQTGRVPTFEIMVATPAIRNLIRKGNVYEIPNSIQTGQQSGMMTMEASFRNLVNKKIITQAQCEDYLHHL